jgi:hypothetical protein
MISQFEKETRLQISSHATNNITNEQIKRDKEAWLQISSLATNNITN